MREKCVLEKSLNFILFFFFNNGYEPCLSVLYLVLIITVVMMVNLSSKVCFACARVTTNAFKFDFDFKCLTVMLRRALKLQASLQDCMYTNVFLTYSMHC